MIDNILWVYSKLVYTNEPTTTELKKRKNCTVKVVARNVQTLNMIKNFKTNNAKVLENFKTSKKKEPLLVVNKYGFFFINY